MNKQLFYNIDALNVAINQGSKVTAKYMEYGRNQELQERDGSPIIFSPYVTLWAEGNYYILAKLENSDVLEHYRIDLLKDITILERGVDMIFGGFNPSQYAKQYIFQNDENKERFEIECDKNIWQEVAECFGTDATVIREERFNSNITVKIVTIPSVMRSWVLSHINECEVIGPKKFRDEMQKTIMEAYRRYC